MFLRLSAEHYNLKSDSKSFIEYWDILPQLTLKESMRNLNSRRVNLKHKGLIPARIEVETSKVNATDFFEQNTKLVFGFDFSEISLIDLIKFSNTQELLALAQKNLDKNSISDCIENATLSFNYLLLEYKKSKIDNWRRTHFSFTKSIRLSRYNSLNKRNESSDLRLEEVVKEINDNFMQIEKGLEVLTLGLDYRKYSKFKFLTPDAYRQSDGSFRIFSKARSNISRDNCQFLIDFVLDCALKLQDFDFDYQDLDASDVLNR
jgi:hypothetical protein